MSNIHEIEGWIDRVQEEIIDPEREIIDPHHHLWHGPEDPPGICLLYTSPSPRDKRQSRMPSSA